MVLDIFSCTREAVRSVREVYRNKIPRKLFYACSRPVIKRWAEECQTR